MARNARRWEQDRAASGLPVHVPVGDGPPTGAGTTESDTGTDLHSTVPVSTPSEVARPALNASRADWKAYAEAVGVTVRAGTSRAGIIAAVDGVDR